MLFGKGPANNRHPGNKSFRSIVDKQKLLFAVADRNEKRRIATQIINDILKIGGRFLVEDTSSSVVGGGTKKNSEAEKNVKVCCDDKFVHPRILAKTWVTVDFDKVMVKVMHRLREKSKVEDGQRKPEVITSNENASSLDLVSPVMRRSSEMISRESSTFSGDFGLDAEAEMDRGQDTRSRYCSESSNSINDEPPSEAKVIGKSDAKSLDDFEGKANVLLRGSLLRISSDFGLEQEAEENLFV